MTQNKNMKIIAFTIISFFLILDATACTTAIISGKHTADGRPLLWKLRDSNSIQNKMMHFTDGEYDYIGLINSQDKKGENVWAGSNSEGFSIMNSASFNVNLEDTSSFKDQEGIIMKLALQECATLQDFELLLSNLPKPMGLASHFGIIDASGGAAFYEVNNYTFTKFDANNSEQAPNGYIIRTNYSFTGKKDIGHGYIRFQTAENIFNLANAHGKINYQTIIQEFSRCFKHPVLNKDFRKEYENIPEAEHFINSGDFITREGAVSTIIIHGVKINEAKDLSTIWTVIGYPNTCIAIPIWIKAGGNMPNLLVGKSSENSPLNDMALKLKAECYPIKTSSGYKYLQISRLFNSDNTGIIPIIESAERDIFAKTDENLKNWRKNEPTQQEIMEFYNWIDLFVSETYTKEFGITQ